MQLAFDPKKPVLTKYTVSAEMIRAYAERVGDVDTLASDCAVAPPTFVLSIHRGFLPEVPLPPDSFALYGGHDLSFHAPIRGGETYSVRAQVVDAYEKSGRSGKMLVIARQATISDSAGAPVAEMIERQVVCRRSSAETAATKAGHASPTSRDPLSATGSAERQAVEERPAPAALTVCETIDLRPLTSGLTDRKSRVRPGAGSPVSEAQMDSSQTLTPLPEVGDELGPDVRRAPSAVHVAGFADDNHIHENLFLDRDFARSLGFRDIIVPGPMQSACLEQFLRKHLPGWRLESLSVTFRIAVISADLIKLSAVVTEVHTTGSRARLDCDLIIESSDGERTTTGQATLSR